MEVIKVRGVINFKQKPWMKNYEERKVNQVLNQPLNVINFYRNVPIVVYKEIKWTKKKKNRVELVAGYGELEDEHS